MKITVVIPHINREDNLRWCLSGLECQSFPKEEFEVVVVGELPEVFKTCFSGNICEVPYTFADGEKFSAAYLRNLGAKNAHGDILAFLDCDMIVPKDYLNNVYKILSMEDALVFSLRRKLMKDASFNNLDELRRMDYDMDEREEARKILGVDYATIKSICFWCFSHTMSMHRLTFEKIGGFYEKFDGWGYEDTELAYRLWKNGIRITCDNKSRCFHIWHDEEMDSTRQKEFLMNLEKFQKLHHDKMLNALDVYKKKNAFYRELFMHGLKPSVWMLLFVEMYVQGYQAGITDSKDKNDEEECNGRIG